MALVAVLAQVHVLTILLSRPAAYAIDYRLYRVAASIGTERGWSHIYDSALQRAAITPLFPPAGWPAWWHSAQAFWAPMVSPPPAAWLAAPFLALPASVAAALWISLLGLALVALPLLAAPPGPLAKLRYGSLVLFTWAGSIALVSGNLVVLLALGLVISARLLEDRRDVVAGLALGLITLKPQVAFAVPLLLLVVGRWRVLIAFLGAAAVLGALSLASLGAQGVASYRHLLSFVATFQGEQALGLGQLQLGAVEHAVLAAALFALIAVAAWVTRQRGASVTVALGILASLLVSPYLNFEDFVLLIPAALLLLRARRSNLEAVFAIALILSATPASQGIVWPAYIALAVTLLGLFTRWPVRPAAARVALPA